MGSSFFMRLHWNVAVAGRPERHPQRSSSGCSQRRCLTLAMENVGGVALVSLTASRMRRRASSAVTRGARSSRDSTITENGTANAVVASTPRARIILPEGVNVTSDYLWLLFFRIVAVATHHLCASFHFPTAFANSGGALQQPALRDTTLAAPQAISGRPDLPSMFRPGRPLFTFATSPLQCRVGTMDTLALRRRSAEAERATGAREDCGGCGSAMRPPTYRVPGAGAWRRGEKKVRPFMLPKQSLQKKKSSTHGASAGGGWFLGILSPPSIIEW